MTAKRRRNQAVICQLCGKKLESGFGSHLFRVHGVTRPEYEKLVGTEAPPSMRKPQTCIECGKYLPNGFGTHLKYVHSMSLMEYHEKHYSLQCACGCGGFVKPAYQGKPSKYILGHSNRKFTQRDDYLLTEAYLAKKEREEIRLPQELTETYSKQQLQYRAWFIGLTGPDNAPIKIRRLSREEAAYVAGIFDGDGNIEGNCRAFSVTEEHTDSLHWLEKTIGAGKVIPVQTKNASRYQLFGQRNVAFLCGQIAQYSVIKREILEEAGEAYRASSPYVEQTELFVGDL